MNTTAASPRLTAKMQVALAVAAVIIVGLSLRAGAGAFASIWFTLLFLLEMIIVSSLTRTTTMRELSGAFVMGAGTLCVAVLLTRITTVEFGIARGTAGRPFVVPILEEASKLLPIAVVTLVGRRSRSLALGLTDFLLMGAFVGAGFQIVEDSYILTHASVSHVVWAPTAEIEVGRAVAGHAVWSAISATAFGIAWLFPIKQPFRILVALSGLAIASLDHIANNYLVSGSSAALKQTMLLIGMNGYLGVVLFAVLVLTSVLADVRAIYFGAGRPLASAALRRSAVASQPLKTWNRVLGTRRLAFVIREYRLAAANRRRSIGRVLNEIVKRTIRESAQPVAAG